MINFIKQISNREEMLNFFPKNITVAELGVFRGAFSNKIFEKIQPKELHLIDVFEGITGSGDKDGNNFERIDIGKEYLILKNFYKNNKNVFLHKGLSYEVIKKFDNNYFDLIYIDADHSYKSVKKDLEISYLKTKNNGFISGHDYNPVKYEGLCKAVNEFCEEYKQKIIIKTKDKLPSFVIKILKKE